LTKARRKSRRAIVVKRFEAPDEARPFEKGSFELVAIGGASLGRARYEPGWKWSEHVGPIVGTASCLVDHVGLVVSGRAFVKMDDGEEVTLGPGDLFSIPGGHDSWVVGQEPYISLHLLGAAEYAAPRKRKTSRRPKRTKKRR
jgi:hypothetical protein